MLSLVSLQLFGIIFSILGLMRASGFARAGGPPVGRKRAAWGLALGIAAPVIVGVLSAIAIPIYLGQQQEARQQVADDAGVSVDQVVVEANGSPAVYDRALYEREFSDAWADGAGSPLEWITCPDSVDLVVGADITCSLGFQGATHQLRITITDIHGNATTSLDGVPVQQ